MSGRSKKSKEKIADKKSAEKIYKKLLNYAIYGTMALILVITIVITTQQQPHDSRSRASDISKTNFQLTAEENNTATDCYTQGDYHSRKWIGELAPLDTFTLYLPFCEGTDLQNVGVSVSIPENPNVSFTVVSPKGKVNYPGLTQNNLKLCLPNIPNEKLTGGVWKIIVANWKDIKVSTELAVIIAPENSDWFQSTCQ